MQIIKTASKSTIASSTAVRVAFLNNPINEIERNTARFLLWSVFQKFISRNVSLLPNIKDTQLTKDLCKDITSFCRDLAVAATPLTESEATKLQAKKYFNKQDVLRAIKSLDKNIYQPKEGYYNDLRNDIYGYSAYTTDKINTSFPRIQLEALCLYALEKSYNEFITEKHRLYIGNGKIQFIKANLSEHFGEFICKMISAIEMFNHSDSSHVINNMLELIKEETDTIIEALSESKIVRPSSKYLNTLYDYMDKATAGFGVNIAEFNQVWKKDIGKKILKINQQQNKGRMTNTRIPIPQFRYRRFFLMNGTNVEEILKKSKKNDIDELETLKIQLEHDVLVYCIFKDDWKKVAGENHNLFDYAVLKVDNCPMLMGTKFDKKNKEELDKGIFFTDPHKAKSHFELTLGKLLKNTDVKVYKPKYNSKNQQVEFDSPIEQSDKNEVMDILKAATDC